MFENSIKKHLKCDVDVGLFLSGGTDSTSIASVINKYHKKIKTFTYDFQNSDKGEGYIAKKIAKKLNFENLSYYLKPRDIENNIDKLTYVLESPFTSIRIIADHNLYKLCREKNVKVVLLGHGGDELLAGYDYNYLPYYVDKSIKDQNYDILANFENNSYLQTGKFIDKNNQNFSFFNQNQVTKDCMPFLQIENFNQDFINENSKKNHQINLNQNNFLKNSQLLDIKYINLPRSLKYADRLSMING